MDIKEQRDTEDTHLQWTEPRIGIDTDGNKVAAHVTSQATIHDCIAMSRHALKSSVASDEFLLDEFITTHWAYKVKRTDAFL